MSDRTVDEVTTAPKDPVDTAALQAENSSLRDRMLRALADAENTRRRADRTAEDASRYAITDFARESRSRSIAALHSELGIFASR